LFCFVFPLFRSRGRLVDFNAPWFHSVLFLSVLVQETPPMESDLPFDFNSIKEEEFDKFVDYIVLDQPPDPNNPNRAESSLPRNLKLKKIGKKVRVETRARVKHAGPRPLSTDVYIYTYFVCRRPA